MSSKAVKTSASVPAHWAIVWRALMKTFDRHISDAMSILDEDDSASNAVFRLCKISSDLVRAALANPPGNMHMSMDLAFDLAASLDGASALCMGAGSPGFISKMVRARALLDEVMELVECAHFSPHDDGEGRQ